MAIPIPFQDSLLSFYAFVLFAGIFAAIVGFLLIREFCLWYFRIGEMVRELKKSNEHLKAIVSALKESRNGTQPPEIGNWEEDLEELFLPKKGAYPVRIGRIEYRPPKALRSTQESVESIAEK